MSLKELNISLRSLAIFRSLLKDPVIAALIRCLSVEEGRTFTYCEYCGTKVMIHDENTQTIHTIDEAAIKRAENETD